jgi:hypothetical protein
VPPHTTCPDREEACAGIVCDQQPERKAVPRTESREISTPICGEGWWVNLGPELTDESCRKRPIATEASELMQGLRASTVEWNQNPTQESWRRGFCRG